MRRRINNIDQNGKLEWRDVSDKGAIARLNYELDSLKEKVDMLRSMADALENNELGKIGHQLIRLVANSISGDEGMLRMDIGTVQEIPQNIDTPKNNKILDNVKLVTVPVLIDTDIDDTDYKNEWIDHANNCIFGEDDGCNMSDDEFMDWIYAQISAALMQTDSIDDIMFYRDGQNLVSTEAVAWAYRKWCDSHQIY